MSKNLRHDQPGSWHHVMNRGLAKRTMFEHADDMRYFLSRLAWAVHRGQIELHAWCVLTTHFHLLVRSPIGELSVAMRRIQNDYSRRFNRTRRRDGPLVRGRFRSKVVNSARYQRILVQYIDENAVRAELAAHPAEYRYGSAYWYARSESPPWHTRDWIEREACRVTNRPDFGPTVYEQAFPQDRQEEVRYVIERRSTQKSTESDEPDILDVAGPDVLAWMRRKAKLGDGTAPGLAVAAPATIAKVIRSARESLGDLVIERKRGRFDGWLVLEAGLLRELAGSRWSEVGSRLGRSTSNARTLGRLHAALLGADEVYSRRASRVVAGVLGREG